MLCSLKWYEDVCADKFGAVKFNYVVLMMRDFFVHYHAFPRYDKDIDMFDMKWKDNDWPGAINFNYRTLLDEEKLLEIKDYMKS